ncbi:hypothetical protein ALC62_00016, partial [Cyphomyrmex costatus]
YNTNVTTEFHSTAKTQKLQLWVLLLVSVLDFFKRKTKEEQFTLKFNEVQNKYNEIDRLIILRIIKKFFIYR